MQITKDQISALRALERADYPGQDRFDATMELLLPTGLVRRYSLGPGDRMYVLTGKGRDLLTTTEGK